MRYMVLDPKRIEGFFGPWVCKTHPGATFVELQHVIDPVPGLDISVLHKGTQLNEISSEAYEYLKSEYRCSQLNDEVVL